MKNWKQINSILVRIFKDWLDIRWYPEGYTPYTPWAGSEFIPGESFPE